MIGTKLISDKNSEINENNLYFCLALTSLFLIDACAEAMVIMVRQKKIKTICN